MKLIQNRKNNYKYLIFSVITIYVFFLFIYSNLLKINNFEYSQVNNFSKINNCENKNPKNNLFLKKNKIEFEFNPNFLSDLEVFTRSSRPDIKNDKISFNFLISNNQIHQAFENEKIYLNKKDNKFVTASSPTDFWIIFSKFNENQVQIDLYAKLINEQKDEIIKSSHFKKENNFFLKLKNTTIAPEFETLSKAYFMDEDLFLQMFNIQKLNKKRLIINDATLFINENDYLIFKNGNWIIPCNEDTKSYPLALIKKIDKDSTLIECFSVDENEKHSFIINNKKDLFDHGKKNEDMISSIKRRTRLFVNLIINNQRFIVREKDVLYKEADKFYIKRNNFELQDFNNKEIIYFEKFNFDGANKHIKVHFFNKFHTFKKTIDFPLNKFITNTNHIKRGLRK
jgi:hypothetical protein